MTDQIPAEAIEAVARVIAEAALDWMDIEGQGHEHTLDCANWEPYTGEAFSALYAALPFLRPEPETPDEN